jgi:hypothetical protein
MNVQQLLAQVFGDPIAGSAVGAVVVLCIAQFVTGSIRAFSNGSFTASAFDAWIRKDVAGRVLPILATFLVARSLPDLSTFGIPVEAGLLAFGLLQAGTYVVAALAGIKDNVSPPPPEVMADKIAAARLDGDTVPTE